MQNVTKQGVGFIKKQAAAITKEQENALWEQGILGNENPQSLLYTIFWTIGVNFGLRGGDEHRNLTLENFKILQDQDEVFYLEYCESVSKTYKGGIKHRQIDPHKARAYEIKGSKRCPVTLFQQYLLKLNPNYSHSAFYFNPLVKPMDDVWYSLTPVGHNKLKDFVKTIMKTAGFEGYFTNHSLRAATATRLFQENIPEQLIMEQTGNRSNALFSYKRSSDQQKRLVSNVLQGSNIA
ncbi:uncharacterized protein KIAA1958-like [Ruditapes philippinarum]|uniref:uncharacterized protein KIAA1958-like n=1 Tax=Ruditapes philippinarum TaxID=129788 RepID=UPI00295C13E6|nr:uncharacterized protein KIAA1958-like [Ruditapes philippinarum]